MLLSGLQGNLEKSPQSRLTLQRQGTPPDYKLSGRLASPPQSRLSARKKRVHPFATEFLGTCPTLPFERTSAITGDFAPKSMVGTTLK